MKNLFITICLLFMICIRSDVVYSSQKHIPNMLKNTNYICKGYLCYDVNSYKYNFKKIYIL